MAGQVEFEKNYAYLGQKICIRNIGSLLYKSTTKKMVAEFEFGGVLHVFIKDLAISHFKILNTAMSLQIYSGTELVT